MPPHGWHLPDTATRPAAQPSAEHGGWPFSPHALHRPFFTVRPGLHTALHAQPASLLQVFAREMQEFPQALPETHFLQQPLESAELPVVHGTWSFAPQGVHRPSDFRVCCGRQP
jgi:hypothetical protein